jgi:glycosyltransferase involved in cell wall biosynthesis
MVDPETMSYVDAHRAQPQKTITLPWRDGTIIARLWQLVISMHILWLDPFHGGSHAAVADGYAARSRHRVTLLSLPIDGGWRWRMRGGAVSLARMARAANIRPDLIVASDMLDLATFRALTADHLAGVPAAVYFHENQLTYPLPPGRKRDDSFAWINYTSALCADAVIFNSAFHRGAFLAALPALLGRHHDYQELQTVVEIAARARVLSPGIDLGRLEGPSESDGGPPVILWNSRWEYDKQPEAFFAGLEALESRGVSFRLIVAGEHIDPHAPAFAAARARWAARSLHWGYAADQDAYASLLRRSDIVVSTAIQEFFGIGVVEAMACGCAPILPRRLNYPALIPRALHADHLYADEAGMADLLVGALARAGTGRDIWRAVAAPYSWAHAVPCYDALFAEVVGS